MKIHVPILVVSEANQREHWAKKRRRQKAQEATVYIYLMQAERDWNLPEFPISVQFTRYGSRMLDNDNLVGAFKAVRDCIAKYYRVDDGDPRWVWLPPKQVKAKRKDAAVEIQLEPIPALAKAGATPAGRQP